MGSDRKKKSHKKKRKRDDGSDSEASEISNGSASSPERRRHKASKKHHKKPKSHKHSKKSRRRGTPATEQEVEQAGKLGVEDYFERHAEFSTWLSEEKGQFFNELSSETARDLFAAFVVVWNGGRLPGKYYNGLACAPIRRTQHKWRFKGGRDEKPEASGLGIRAQMDEKRDSRSHDRSQERFEQKRWNREQRVLLDELLPKATGREAKMEKRVARREAQREREQSPDAGAPFGGGDIMGANSSFDLERQREAERKLRRQEHRMARKEEASRRLAEYQAGEDDKLAHFRALIASGEGLKIQKRNA